MHTLQWLYFLFSKGNNESAVHTIDVVGFQPYTYMCNGLYACKTEKTQGVILNTSQKMYANLKKLLQFTAVSFGIHIELKNFP